MSFDEILDLTAGVFYACIYKYVRTVVRAIFFMLFFCVPAFLCRGVSIAVEAFPPPPSVFLARILVVLCVRVCYTGN